MLKTSLRAICCRHWRQSARARCQWCPLSWMELWWGGSKYILAKRRITTEYERCEFVAEHGCLEINLEITQLVQELVGFDQSRYQLWVTCLDTLLDLLRQTWSESANRVRETDEDKCKLMSLFWNLLYTCFLLLLCFYLSSLGIWLVFPLWI